VSSSRTRDEGPGTRLNRYLARCGASSRRGCDALIEKGLVSINGRRADSPGMRVMPGDAVECGGRILVLPPMATAAFNKPVGMEVTLAGDSGRGIRKVLSAMPAGCVPVGRLDINTSGLLLLSNDGELVFRLSHPRWCVEREYLLYLEKPPSQPALAGLGRGVLIGPGQVCRPIRFERSGPLGLKLVLGQGRHHEVRRLAEAAGLALAGLERLRYGPVSLGGLGRGGRRLLAGDELEKLYRCVDLEPPDSSRP